MVMMECCSLIYTHLVLFLLFSSLTLFSLGTDSMVVALSKERRCRDDEKGALLQFKHSLASTNHCNGDWDDVDQKPKLESWTEEGDCCSWEGVECDEHDGDHHHHHHVVGLDLSQSCLFGSINSRSNSLFSLAHLQRLDLSWNDFNYSHIPSAIGNLSRLTHLHLTGSNFSGQIPQQYLSNITTMVSLDLSSSGYGLLELRSLKGLVQHMSNLKHLRLSFVNLSSSALPRDLLSNSSSLESLVLNACELKGEFPAAIFNLPKLKILDLSENYDLKGYLPNFRSGSPLKSLWLVETSFGGVLPPSIGNLVSLEELEINNNKFTGDLPMSLGNLTHLVSLGISGFTPDSLNTSSLSWIGKLTKLSHLFLHDLDLTGEIPSWLMNLTRLTHLRMSNNRLSGPIPSWLMALPQLKSIYLSHNQLSGHIPPNLNHLIDTLDLSFNNLEGSIPTNLSTLPYLSTLSLHHSRFFGSMDLSFFCSFKYLDDLKLSYNNLSLSLKNISLKNDNCFPTFRILELASCNLLEFPTFLQNNENILEALDLSNNHLKGQIPSWIFDLGQYSENGLYLNLSHNLLTGFEREHPLFNPEDKIRTLDLRHNMLQGPLPIPPLSTTSKLSSYLVSNNSFSGELSNLICNFISLLHLDLSSNSLSGKLPQCLSNLSDNLVLLDVKGNKFDGNIPLMWRNGCKLRMIDTSYNQLQGQLPRSLTNCSQLEFVDFGNNQLRDTFPFWLGRLTMLSVLILQSNRFHGVINDEFGFSNLRVIDLSNNRFKGKLPSKFINSSEPMRALNPSHTTKYMELDLDPTYVWNDEDFGTFDYSMILHNKGMEMNYLKIPDILCTIDFSSNSFEGKIPHVYGDLIGVEVLNLSRNHLIGNIPSSFSNMKNLESLDLSLNHLSGNIPTELTKLTSLSSFNVSFNNLSGRIPQGNQFCTFDSESYEGNPGLSFDTWNKQCGNARSLPQVQQPPSPTEEEEEDDDESDSRIKWMIILIGFVSGLVVGVILGNELTTRKHYWFVKTFARIQRWYA